MAKAGVLGKNGSAATTQWHTFSLVLLEIWETTVGLSFVDLLNMPGWLIDRLRFAGNQPSDPFDLPKRPVQAGGIDIAFR